MTVNALDHVNIVAHDLDTTVAFYGSLLGLTRLERSMLDTIGVRGAWLCDETGTAILHVQAFDPDRHRASDAGPLTPTGAIDHVALRCTGFAETLARVVELGLEHAVNDRKYGELRQIFIHDPDQVRLELNFSGD
jgi:catechol 2,3-dioxygenase-like lactoylglutathione lyase family enzyme